MSGESRTFRRLTKIAARACVSLALLAWVWPDDPGTLVRELGTASPSWLVAAFALHGVGVWLSAVRWRMLLSATGTQVGVGRLASSYLVGFFFNTWLPSGFGGDAVRAWDTRREAEGAARSVAVIAIERGTGILALVMLGAVVSAVAGWHRQLPSLVVMLWAASLGGAAILAGLAVYGPAIAARLESAVPGLWRWRRAAGAARRLLVTSAALSADRRLITRVLALGVLLQLNVVLHYAWIARSLAVPVSSTYFFIVVPVLVAVLTLPLSINGIGARELVFVRLLGAVGVPEAQALAVSLCAFGMTLAFSLIGGLVYVFRGTSSQP